MQFDSLNPYASPVSSEPVPPSEHPTRIAWYAGIALTVCVSAIATFFSVLLTIDIVEGNVAARSVPAVLFMLFGFMSILAPVGFVMKRHLFWQLSMSRQWIYSVVLPVCYVVLTAMLLVEGQR